jgi:hypothetical protein
MNQAIPGYTFGTSSVAKSTISDIDFDHLRQSVLFSDDDVQALRHAGEVLAGQIEEVLDVWYGFVGGHPHLAHYFSNEQDKPDSAYMSAVRKRFGQWIRDTCSANYDRAWLDYQQEIAVRHTPDGKNKTDGVRSSAPLVPLRYIIAFIYPITATMRPFLAYKGHSEAEVEKMDQAWFKAVTLQIALWCQPFAKPGMF